MNAPAAIKASFSDYRRVKGRKVGQLVFEVPLESFQAAIAALGGEPAAVEERWVGIALLDPNVLAATPKAEKPKRSFDELPASQQAAMLCNEPRFQTFLEEVHVKEWEMASDGERPIVDIAADIVRTYCGVQSRAYLDKNPAANALWQQLHSEYRAWLSR